MLIPVLRALQLRMMCQLDNWVEVTILPPYIPSAQEKADKVSPSASDTKNYLCKSLSMVVEMPIHVSR